MSQLRLFLFGSPRLERDGVVQAMDTRKAMALLSYLALTGQVHSRDALAALFWPEYEQSQARGNLRRTLSTLARAVGKESLETDRESIGLVPDNGLWVDVRRFQELVTASNSHPHPDDGACATCQAGLTEALALYQAEFMAGFSLPDSPAFEEWQFFQNESLRREIGSLLEKLVGGHSQHGHLEAATDCARRWVALDPLDETAQRWLMQLYAWAGQRSAALRQYQSLARLLQEELDLSPDEETEALYQAIQENRLSPPPAIAPEAVPVDDLSLSPPPTGDLRPHTLPAQTTTFIGRESELAALTTLLADPACRLLTLVGPGGVGKTRLAIELAANRRECFGDGVSFVSLASISNSTFIPAAIADTLGLALHGVDDPGSQLLDYLRTKQLLLVLDNLEHLLLPGSPIFTLLVDILRHATQVKLLVTSRQRLHLQGEWVFEIQGLPVPPAQPLGGFEDYSAVNLFIQSARRIDHGFYLSLADQPAVARICRLVDGTPLGIELAAAWVHLLSCTEIAAEIERNLDFLAVAGPDLPARHRSLRAAFKHSWNLLSSEERRVLGQLSIFQGGFGRESAEQVTGASLNTLSALVDKSLVHRTCQGRYDLHELVRQYTTAELQKTEPSTLEKARQRHSDYYLTLLARKEIDIKGARQPAVVSELSSEIGNLRLAWQWAVTHGQIEALRSAFPTLLIFFEVRSWFQIAVTFFEQAVEGLRASAAHCSAAPGQAEAEPQRWRLCLALMKIGQGFFLFRLGQSESDPAYMPIEPTASRAIRLLKESVALLETLGDRVALAYAHLCLGVAGYTTGDFEDAREVLLTGLDISRTRGDTWLTAVHLGHLGMIAYSTGQCVEAEQRLAEGVALWREVGDVRGLVFNLSTYGMVSAALGQFGRAQQLLDESLLISGQNNDRWGVANAFNYLGQIALERKPADFEAAHYFLTESATIFRELGARWMLVSVLNNLGQIATGQGKIKEAKQAFLEALDMAISDPILPAALEALLGLAELLMAQEEFDQASEIIAQVMNHPASSQHSKDKAGQLWPTLAARFSTDQLETLMSHASCQSLQTIAARLQRSRIETLPRQRL